jgi:hypothetical protein
MERATMEREETSESSQANTDQTFEEFLKKPTTVPVDLTITLTSFLDEQDARSCGDVFRGYLDVFGRLMDLSLLDRVYVSFDYEGTLASLDIGTGSDTILKPTNDEIATGVAMAPSVLRDGVWKSVIVINASYARSLSYELTPEDVVTEEQLEAFRAETVHILAHECGHVHDHAMQTKHLPHETYSKKWSPYEHRLKEPAMACWGEYIAEFHGAGFATKDTLNNYEETFCQRLEVACPAITASIRQYRMHGKVDQVIDEVGRHIRNVIMYAAYLMGYLEKTEQELGTAAPKVLPTAKQHPSLGIFVERIQTELQTLHDQYPFQRLEVFSPLSELIHDMYKAAGLTFTENADRTLRVDIPHRPDTLPSLEEQLEFLARAAKSTSS